MAGGINSIWRTAEYCVRFCVELDIVEIRLKIWKQRRKRSLSCQVEELRRLPDFNGSIHQRKCYVAFSKFGRRAWFPFL